MARLKPLPFREIKRRPETLGFVEVSPRGSHVKFARHAGEVVDTAIVAKKHEVPAGTIRSIVSQERITPEDWEKLT